MVWEMLKPDAGAIASVPYDEAPVLTIVPVFPYDLTLHTSYNSSTRLTKRTDLEARDLAVHDAWRFPRAQRTRVVHAAIQGNLDQGRRDYKGIFAELEKEIRSDPKLWGYIIPDEDAGPDAPILPDPSIPDPFVLVRFDSLLNFHH